MSSLSEKEQVALAKARIDALKKRKETSDPLLAVPGTTLKDRRVVPAEDPNRELTVAEKAALLAPNKDPVIVARNVDGRIKTKAIQKIFGKTGKILRIDVIPIPDDDPNYRIEFDKAEDATYAMKKLQGKVALDKKLLLTYETDSRGPSEEQKIRAISNKLKLLERGIEHNDLVGVIKPPKNSYIFNRKGASAPIFNGLGTTRTKQSTTLFVSNIPFHVANSPNLEEIMTKTFEHDAGFFSVRLVRQMCFVDYHSVQDATKAMVNHQNQRIGGSSLGRMGLMIDYDKDSRSKRNMAYEKTRGKEPKYAKG
eukprot:m.30675 g.30675  ORF g.30675 m.30675 type:complete len:310 (-) comp16328_c0_seq1:280-1209(-)